MHQENLEDGGTLHPETESLGAEDDEGEHLGNGSLEVSYVEDSMDMADGASAHDLVGLDRVGASEDFVRSRSPEPTLTLHDEDDATPELSLEASIDTIEGGQKLEGAKDDIADIVGLLESTSFTSKHILQGPDEGIVIDPRTPGSDKEGQRIGEIPDEE